MNAADHYAAAERVLEDVAATVERGYGLPGQGLTLEQLLALAQVHATLALTAVQAEHTVVVTAGSTTAHGVVDMRETVRRMSFAKGSRA